MTEVWKPIPNYEGIYGVSNLGRIRSEGRIDSIGRRKQERIMRTNTHKDGYLQIDLLKDGKRNNVLVHRLVMLAFIGECPKGYEVNHINEDKADNRIDNLEYVTHVVNVRHGTGRIRQAQSTKKPVVAILPNGEIEHYESAKDAGRALGVDGSIISHAIKDERRKTAYGRIWKYAEIGI